MKVFKSADVEGGVYLGECSTLVGVREVVIGVQLRLEDVKTVAGKASWSRSAPILKSSG